jgi:hypothetical protein
MRAVLVAVWIALAASGACVVGSLALVVTRGLRAWRTLRALLRHVSRRLGELEEQAAATEQKAVDVTAKTSRLAEASAHLQQSLATLAVLCTAAEARSGAGRIRGLVPRK